MSCVSGAEVNDSPKILVFGVVGDSPLFRPGGGREDEWYTRLAFRHTRLGDGRLDTDRWEREVKKLLGPVVTTSWIDAGTGRFTVKLFKGIGERECQLTRSKNDYDPFTYNFQSDSSYLGHCFKGDVKDTTFITCGTAVEEDEATCLVDF